MKNLLTDLMSSIGSQNIKKIANKSNIPKGKRTDLVTTGMEVLLGSLSKNNKNFGSDNLLNILKDHKNNLNNVDGILEGTIKKDGGKILEHILLGEKDKVIDKLAKVKNIDQKQAGELLQNIAPILMGSLSKKFSNTNNDSGILGNVLDSFYKDSIQKGNSNSFLKILDFDNDGEISDNIGTIMSWIKKLFPSKK